MAYEYVKQFYGIHPEVGMRVVSADGKKTGTIVAKRSYDHYVYVRLDGQKHDVPFHPMDLVYAERKAGS